jgi:hypothetical protein
VHVKKEIGLGRRPDQSPRHQGKLKLKELEMTEPAPLEYDSETAHIAEAWGPLPLDQAAEIGRGSPFTIAALPQPSAARSCCSGIRLRLARLSSIDHAAALRAWLAANRDFC